MASMTVKEVLAVLDSLAPFCLAESWDHVGLRAGFPDAEVHGAAFFLDATAWSVRRAADSGCDLLVTHHPLMFGAQENMICDRPESKAVQAAFSRGVSVISCHTNLDSAKGGVNDVLARLAGMSGLVPMEPPSDERGFGMGAVGDVEPCSCEDFCGRTARAWKLSGYRFFDSGRTIKRVALCGGAGGSMWRTALEKGADIYATADMRYNEALDALDAGLSLMICDHGEMENNVMKPFSENFAERVSIPVVLLDGVAADEKHSYGWRSPE